MSEDYSNIVNTYFAKNAREKYDFTNLHLSEIFQMLITISKNHKKLSMTLSPEKKLEIKYVMPISPEKRFKKREFPIYIKRTNMPLKENGNIDLKQLRKIIFSSPEAFIIYYYYKKNFEGEEGKIPLFVPKAEFNQEKQKYNCKKRIYSWEISEKQAPFGWPYNRHRLDQIINDHV